MEADKEIRADAKLKNLSHEELEVMWEFRNPGPGGKKLTFSSIRLQVPLRFGFTVSQSTLSDFYSWLRLKRQWDRAAATAAQARLEMAKDTNFADEDLDKFAERVLKAEAMETGNAKNYVAIAKVQLSRAKQEHDRDKLTAASKSKVEARLDALLAEIQGNPKALAAFQIIQQEVSKG